jgi:hypothetical protein
MKTVVCDKFVHFLLEEASSTPSVMLSSRDRPLYGLKKFSTTIPIPINDLPTTSPDGSYSDTMQKSASFCWIRTRHVAQQRHAAKAANGLDHAVGSVGRNNGASDRVSSSPETVFTPISSQRHRCPIYTRFGLR